MTNSAIHFHKYTKEELRYCQVFLGEEITAAGLSSRIVAQLDKRALSVTDMWLTSTALNGTTPENSSFIPLGTVQGFIDNQDFFPKTVLSQAPNTVFENDAKSFSPPFFYRYSPKSAVGVTMSMPSMEFPITQTRNVDVTFTDVAYPDVAYPYVPALVVWHRRNDVCEVNPLPCTTRRFVVEEVTANPFTAGTNGTFFTRINLPTAAKRISRLFYKVTETIAPATPIERPIFYGTLALYSSEQLDGIYPIFGARPSGNPFFQDKVLDMPVIVLNKALSSSKQFDLFFTNLQTASYVSIQFFVEYEICAR